MASRKEELSADRLCAASAAVLRAVKEIADDRAAVGKGGAFVAPYPPDLMGSSIQPACLCDFTKFEVTEATAFLIRMGFLQYPRTAA
jgi:hypothetical protein